MSLWTRRNPRAASRLRPPAFTLVELLVVIGIIALLISILMPALGQAKRKAQAVVCMANVKQIYTAMQMFAQDHKGCLPQPYLVGQTSMSSPTDPATPTKWPNGTPVAETLAWAQRANGFAGHIDLRDDASALWKYLPGEQARTQIMMCPGDNGEALFGHARDESRWPRNCSYSLNRFLLRQDQAKLLLRLGSIKNAARKIMIYEEIAPNDSWCIMASSLDDKPTARHGISMRANPRPDPPNKAYLQGSGNYGFFDGHVEPIPTGSLIPVNGGNNSWVYYHWPLVATDAYPGGWPQGLTAE